MITPLLNINKFRKIKGNAFEKKTNCTVHMKKWIQTNPKFSSFDQTIYHAGDEDDFQKYGLLPFRYYFSNEEYKTRIKQPIFKLYKNIDYESVYNTFTYLFYKFKKSIFVVIFIISPATLSMTKPTDFEIALLSEIALLIL